MPSACGATACSIAGLGIHSPACGRRPSSMASRRAKHTRRAGSDAVAARGRPCETKTPVAGWRRGLRLPLARLIGSATPRSRRMSVQDRVYIMPPMPPIPPMPPGMPPPGRGLLRLGLLGDQGLGGQQQPGDRRRVLQRRAHDLGRVDDAGLDQVLVDSSVAALKPRAPLPVLRPSRPRSSRRRRRCPRSSGAGPRGRGGRC